MASNFSSIGLAVESGEDLKAVLLQAVEDVEDIPCAEGRYLRWASGQGAELWLQVDGTGDIVGVTPYFNGKSEMRVAVTAPVDRPDDTPFEGVVHGWAEWFCKQGLHDAWSQLFYRIMGI